MAKCIECGCKYRMNANRLPTCRDCRRDAKEAESFAKWEEKFEASMGPKPDYVKGGTVRADIR